MVKLVLDNDYVIMLYFRQLREQTAPPLEGSNRRKAKESEMTTIKTHSHCLAPMIAGKAEAEAAKVAEYLQAEPAAVSGTGETDLFRFTFRKAGNIAVLRIFPHMMGNEFSGEAYAEWR